MPQPKIFEIDLTVPALRALEEAGGAMDITDLRGKLTDIFQPEGVNAQVLAGRTDTVFDQTVRNIVSNRDTVEHNLINRGFATFEPAPGGGHGGTLRVTEQGEELLRSIGYAVPAAV